MKSTLIFLIILLIALAGYAYHKNPAGCMKLVDDFGALFESISPVRVKVEVADPSSQNPTPMEPPGETPAPTPTPLPFPVPTPIPTPTPVPTPLPGIPSNTTSTITPVPSNSPISPEAMAALKNWLAPMTIPDQTHWNWVTTDKVHYTNVKIVKIEPDCVTILFEGGGALVPISMLPDDIQKQLNYDPLAASAAAAIRKQQEDATARQIAAEHAAQAPTPTPKSTP